MTDELNLSGVVDSTAERVLSDSADFQFGLARKLVEASDGELTGTGVAISDNGDGVARVETTFDRARRNLNLARDMNPDQEAAAIRVSAERGLPLPLVRAMDNRDMKQPPDLTSVSPEVVRFLEDDLSHAAVAGDDVENLSGIVDAAECAAMTPEERREELLSTIRREGYSASQLAELKAAGLSPLPDDPEGKSGVFSMDSMASIGATTRYPVLENWYSGPEEVNQMELAKDATDRFREMLRTGFDRVRGSAWLANATPDTAKSYIQTLDREIVTMQGLYALYGESWQEFNDEELSRAVAEVGRALNFDTGAVSIARLRPAGVGWETDWERVFDVFGTVSAYENRTKLSQKELDEVHKNPSGFSQADRMELVDHLESQARALRGRTGWNQAVETVVHTLPYMAQLGGTSAVANIPSVMRTLASGGGLKAVFRTIGRLAMREGVRLGAFVPQRGREMIEETRGQVVPILRDGVILPGMTEDQTSEMADVFFNKMLDTYIENFSEGLGGFFPGTGKLLGPLMRVVPRRLKNAAFVGVAKHVLGDVSRSKGAKIANMVYERSMFNGLLGEYMEEKWGDAIRTVSTELARAVGTKFGDLGQENVFGTVDDELQLMGSLLLTGTVLNTVRIPTAIGDIRRSVQFVDAQRALHTPVESSVTAQRSPETVETLLRYYTRSKDTAYLAPEGARLLYQSAPELLERIGISENVVAESELSGRMIPVSMAKVHTHVSRAELDTLLAKLVPDPGHVLTFEDAKNVDLSAEAQRVAEDTDRVRAETKAAYDEAIQKMMKLNRPASEIRAVAKLLSMANYFDAESDMSAADFIRGIDFQSMGFQEWLAQQSAGAELRLTQEALSCAVRQKFGSGATSLRQVAAGFKKVDFAPGTVNLDLGGGKFDEGTKYLAERGVTNLVYDPVNRSSGENWKIYDAVRNGGVDTVTCNNVLNVIGEAEVRDNVILQAAKALKPGGVAYFTVYEGDGSGKGRQSKADSWQEHRKTKTYVGEVERHFGSVSLRNGVIEARDPITGEKVSAWFNDGLSASPSLFQSDVISRPGMPPLFPEKRKEVERQRADVRAKFENTAQWLKAPNGAPTNLTEDQWVTVRTPFFKEWFGEWEMERPEGRTITEDSAPVTSALTARARVSTPVLKYSTSTVDRQAGLLDENGEPLIVYHGTNARFDSFGRGDTGFHVGGERQAKRKAEEKSEDFGGSPVEYAGFINIRNPIYFPYDFIDWSGNSLADSLLAHEEEMRKEYGFSDQDMSEIRKIAGIRNRERSGSMMRVFFRRKGYDSIEYENDYEGAGSSYILFRSGQFKSVDNLGTFDPKDARFYFQAVGDKFRAIRDALPEETGATPLFGKRFSSVKQILPALAEIFNRFPDSVTAADGKKVLIKNPDGGSVAKRLMHLIAGADENSGDRNSFEFSNKIAWIPRIVETVENAQVKLRDPQTGNYAYVRSYSEGVIHSVVVTKNGVVADTETFDHGLITQFAAKYAGRRGEFTVVWERTDGGPSSAPTSANGSQGNDPSALTSKEEGGKQSPQSPSTGESNGDTPYSPSAETNIAPSLKNVKLLQGDEIPRGATTFNDAWEATITLFEETADASTLIHELGHYATEMMRHLVESGAAGERMQRDYATLMEWAAKGESDFVMQREKLARAFEAYCMEGRAPSIELEGAFATLRRLLLHIYRSVKALGVELSSEVRSVFDGMLATDETMREDSIIREAAMEINKELLGLSQPEIRTFRELIEKANDQAVQQLTEEKNAQLAKLRPQWRKEAEILMEGDPVYKAYRIIRKDGGIDYTALEEISGAAAAEELRRRGLATGKRSRGKHPATLAAESGFVTVEEMVDRLSSEKAPREFIADYLADAERRFNEGFEASESALSVNASIDALEKLSELLAVKGGRKGFSLRRALLRRRALEEIDGMPVRDVVGDRKLIGDCRMNARKLTQAANAGDFATALEAAQHLRYNLELLRMKGDAKKAVFKLERQLSRARHAKKGRIFGDHQRALQDLSYRFGFTRSAPSLPGDATVQSVIDEYNSEAGMNGDAPLDVPAWIMNATASCRDLTFADFRTLSMVAEFLDGEGRALVGAREAAFRNEVKASIEKCVSELSVRKHKFIRGGAGAPLRRAAQWGTKLRNIMGQAGRWNPESEFLKLYDDMNFAESENFILQTGPLREVSAALDILYRETRGIDLRNLPSFPEDVAAEAYHSWDAEKLVACCLNMGNAANRQRLRDGFQWGESDLDLIASRLSRAGWEQIQRIWDAIGKGELADRARQTFKDEYHFDLRIEEPTPFSVTTADGVNLEMEGGYYPLEYLFHRNSVVEDRKAIGHAFPVYRRASFTFERNKKSSDPLRLSLRVAQSHIYDVSHYISHRRTMRKVLRVVNDHTFRTHFCRTQGFERYDALRALVQNVATPDAMREAEHWIDTLGRPLVTAAGLWGNLSVAAMQLSSVTVGVDELGSYYLESVLECASHPERARALVMAKSGMMRDRLNMKDLDLRVRVNRFSEGTAAQVRRDLIEAGYWGMRQVDMAVATPAWIGAYNKALDDGKNERRAVAAADEFVAKTQGAARPIDLSPIQLSAIGRGVTIFFSATSAVATTATRTLSRIAAGDLRGGAAAAGLMANCIAPFLFAALIRYALAGSDDDDPDKARRAFLRELIVSPFSGIPLVRDFADSAAVLAVGQRTGGRQAIFENAGLRGLNDVGSAAYGAIAALADENVDRALYKCVELAGTMLQIPIVTAWNRARRILENFGVDDLPDMEKETRKR